MPKKFFKQWMPQAHHIRSHPHLQMFGDWLHEPNLWHLNRRSLSGGMAVGLFTAFIPLPLQMVIASALAVLFRVNVPLAFSLVWITNPLTIPIIFYSTYLLGCFLLGEPSSITQFEASFEWIQDMFGEIWQPLLLGSVVTGSVSALMGYFLTRYLWRLHVMHLWQQRCARRQQQ